MDTLTGVQILTKNGALKPIEEVVDSKITTIVYYFSAGYINEADSLLSTLRKVHKESKKRSAGLEIIFVSSDNSEEEFNKEFFSDKHSDWCALPYGSTASIELRYRYNITNIPNVVVVRKDGEIVTLKGREELGKIGINVVITWAT